MLFRSIPLFFGPWGKGSESARGSGGVARSGGVLWLTARFAAANTLQSHVSFLCRAWGDRGVIRARPPGYCLEIGGEATDVQRVERLVRQGSECAIRAGAGGPATSAPVARGDPRVADPGSVPLRSAGRRAPPRSTTWAGDCPSAAIGPAWPPASPGSATPATRRESPTRPTALGPGPWPSSKSSAPRTRSPCVLRS